MPKVKDVKTALEKLAEEVKLFRGLRGPVVGSGNEMKSREGYAVFASSDPHVASSYANPLMELTNWDGPHAVFPFRARPKKIIEFPVKPSRDASGNTFDKFAFDQMAANLKPGEALVARNVYDAGPRASTITDPDRRYSYPSDVWAVGPEVETTPLHKAKGGKVGNLEAIAQYVKNKLPQTGFFSTLDELIANAPFEKAPLDQWQNYLQPGRTFEREGVKFPLKKEEIDYSGLNDLISYGSPIEKARLREILQERRPDFRLRIGQEDAKANLVRKYFPEESAYEEEELAKEVPDGPIRDTPTLFEAQYPEYAHEHTHGNYAESVTRSTDFGPDSTAHFGPDTISYSRTTLQPVARSANTFLIDPPEQKLMRLIEEIQSDRHQRAADRVPLDKTTQQFADSLREQMEALPEGPQREELRRRIETAYPPVLPRRGYRTAEDERTIKNLEDRIAMLPREDSYTDQFYDLSGKLNQLTRLVPDTPFKDPADYALLELKQQLLHASRQGQDYLGLINAKDVSRRFGHTDEQAAGNTYAYDKIYRNQLEKLARQYGIPVEDVKTQLKSTVDIATPTMRRHALETTGDILNDLRQADLGDPDDLNLHFDRMQNIIGEMSEKAPREAEKAYRSMESLERELRAGSPADAEDLSVLWSNADVRSWFNQLDEDFQSAHDVYASKIKAENQKDRLKTFRSMVLTPEIREKILKAGIPIWSLGATGVGLSMLDGESDEPVHSYAEGGSVLADRLEALKAAWRRGQPGRDYLRSGVLSQLEGLNEKGEAGFENPVGWRLEDGELKPYVKWRPGMVDELMALPNFGEYLGLTPPDWAKTAQERSDLLHQKVRDQLELDEPKEFGDAALESLGMMLTQIPTPVKGEKAMGTIGKEARDFGSKIAGSPLEFLLPTVNPREPANYLYGTLAGGVLGQLGANEPDEKITPIRKASGGEVSTEGVAPLQRMLENLRTRYEQLTGSLSGENDAV